MQEDRPRGGGGAKRQGGILWQDEESNRGVERNMDAGLCCPEQCGLWQPDCCGLLLHAWLMSLSHISSTCRQILLSGRNIWWSNIMQDFVRRKEAADAWTQHWLYSMWHEACWWSSVYLWSAMLFRVAVVFLWRKYLLAILRLWFKLWRLSRN